MLNLTDLRNTNAGRPAAVLGGGPSLAGDLMQVLPLEPLLIGVNHHALCIGFDPDFVVFLDDPQLDPVMFQTIKDYAGIKVTHDLRYTDVHMSGVNWWNGPMSSHTATWLACWMGCDPVLLCGMDCYQGERKYCHDKFQGYHAIFDKPLDHHLRAWKRGLLPDVCPGVQRVRAVSGPLVAIFGQYQTHIAK